MTQLYIFHNFKARNHIYFEAYLEKLYNSRT